MQTSQIVVGLGFGDEGKGKTVDFLSKKYNNSIVVRFNGGQQAGHTVVTKDTQHVFSNYGSGTLNGCPSYFSEHTSIFLHTLNNEKCVLNKININPKLYVHPLTKLTTPYDVAYNRVLEKENNHGSCGLGIASTMKRHNEANYKLYAIDLLNSEIFIQKLNNIKIYYENLLNKYNLDKHYFYQEYHLIEDTFIDYSKNWFKLFQIKDYSFLKGYNNIIFEGAQGILLDMDHGIFPNVTYSNTTCKNAIEICNKINIFPDIYYITRCYQTRHGNGWMSNVKNLSLKNNEYETNIYNEWQKNFKIGEFDYNLINYALEIDKLYYNEINNKYIVVNCLDQRDDFELKYNLINDIHDFHILESFTPKSEFKEKKKVF